MTGRKDLDFLECFGRWHAVMCAPKCERFVAAGLTNLGFMAYLPVTHETEIVRGVKIDVVRPTFPRYCFVLFRQTDQWWRVLDLEGVENVLTMTPVDCAYRVPLQLTAAETQRMFCDQIHGGIVAYLASEGHIKSPSMRKSRKNAAARRRIAMRSVA